MISTLLQHLRGVLREYLAHHAEHIALRHLTAIRRERRLTKQHLVNLGAEETYAAIDLAKARAACNALNIKPTDATNKEMRKA